MVSFWISVSHEILLKKLESYASTHAASLVIFSERVKQAMTFLTTNEARKITDRILPLIYLIECTKCHHQYTRETKLQLSERFGDHRLSILNHQQFSTTTSVSLHFNQAGHSINDFRLILIELIRSKRDSVRKAREAHFKINNAKTLHPFGINRRDKTR